MLNVLFWHCQPPTTWPNGIHGFIGSMLPSRRGRWGTCHWSPNEKTNETNAWVGGHRTTHMYCCPCHTLNDCLVAVNESLSVGLAEVGGYVVTGELTCWLWCASN